MQYIPRRKAMVAIRLGREGHRQKERQNMPKNKWTFQGQLMLLYVERNQKNPSDIFCGFI